MFRDGSFFDEIPADAYLLKSVLNDWDDARSAAILRNCANAMHADARLVIVERLMPAQLTSSPRDQAAAASDINMMVALSGRERTEPEYRTLLAEAGLAVERIAPTYGPFALIVALRRVR